MPIKHGGMYNVPLSFVGRNPMSRKYLNLHCRSRKPFSKATTAAVKLVPARGNKFVCLGAIAEKKCSIGNLQSLEPANRKCRNMSRRGTGRTTVQCYKHVAGIHPVHPRSPQPPLQRTLPHQSAMAGCHYATMPAKRKSLVLFGSGIKPRHCKWRFPCSFNT